MLLSRDCEAAVGRLEMAAKVIWAALVFSLVLYVGVAFLVVPLLGMEPQGPWLLRVLAAVAAIEAVGAIVVQRRKLHGDPALRAALEQTADRPPAGLPIHEEMSADDRRIIAALAQRNSLFVMLLAIHESVGLLGLVAALPARRGCASPW